MGAIDPAATFDITLTFPESLRPRIVQAVANINGYQAQVPGPDGTPAPNPVTRAQFARKMLKRYVRECVRAWEAQEAAEAARKAAVQAADAALAAIADD
jgi:hypothetical protein